MNTENIGVAGEDRVDRWETLEACPQCQRPTRVKAVGGTLDGRTFTRLSSKDGCEACGSRGVTNGQ